MCNETFFISLPLYDLLYMLPLSFCSVDLVIHSPAMLYIAENDRTINFAASCVVSLAVV